MPWIIDDVHSHIAFSVKHMMVATVRGQFKRFSGTIELDREDFTRSTFTGEIEVASIDTGNAQRDDHLRNSDFFDAENHPKITYVSERIEPKGDGDYVLHGVLTMRGVSKPVALDVELSGVTKNPWGQTVAGLSARGAINRKDFGVHYNAILEAGGVAIGEMVKIELDVEATLAQESQPETSAA